MIINSILVFFDNILKSFVDSMPVLPTIPLNDDVGNFIVETFRVMNCFFDLQLIGNLFTVTLGIYVISLTFRLYYILKP